MDVVIRYKNSEATLPAVLEALGRQTGPSFRILGVDTGSTDGSTALLRAGGADIINWEGAYSHPKVLNFGIRHCSSDFVLVLSSHTVLQAPDTLERMLMAMDDPKVACVSGKWDADPFFGDRVDWAKLRTDGMKFGSIYSNSMGMIRRACWLDCPFDETLDICEDYSWAVEQLRRGHVCRRLDFPFDYQRSRNDRHFEMSLDAFKLAKRTGLKLVWLGSRGTAAKLAESLFTGNREGRHEHWGKLRAWFKGR